MYGDWFTYWPPFFDPTAPDAAHDRPAFTMEKVVTITGPDTVESVLMPVARYYL